MRLEKEIKISKDIDIVFQIFADPNFTIPKIFPNISSIRVEGMSFEFQGGFLMFSYTGKGRVYVGTNEIRFIYDTDKGSGVLYIKRKDDSTLLIILDHDRELYGLAGKRYVSSNLDKLAKKIDEIIRLERIKRKI